MFIAHKTAFAGLPCVAVSASAAAKANYFRGVCGRRTLQPHDRLVRVRGREIRADETAVEVNGRPLTLEPGREAALP